MSNIKRLYETIRHLKLSQILHRSLSMGKRKIAYPFNIINMRQFERKAVKYPLNQNKSFIGLLFDDDVSSDTFSNEEQEILLVLAEDIKKYKFTFLNTEHQFTSTIGWNDQQLAHLWRYNLHYFEYAQTLGCAWRIHQEGNGYYQAFKNIALDWIRSNQVIGKGDGWHPYTISLRLVSWTYTYELFKPLLNDDHIFLVIFLKSYYIQSIFLLHNLEWDVLGNHLIENGRALVFAGLFLDHPDANKLLQKGLDVLWEQLREQILNDGGHYERAPMYHQIVLRDYLEVIRLLKLNQIIVSNDIINKVHAMLDFHNQTLHPDGGIALLNDSAFHIASEPAMIRRFASKLEIAGHLNGDKISNIFDRILVGNSQLAVESAEQLASFFCASDTGYYVYRNNNFFLIADAGPPSPDFLPAHAHADFGTYELSVFGKRWIVDSGVYQYQGELRNKFRGTAAHNCMQIDGENQTDVWGSFRMARRAKPVKVGVTHHSDKWALTASHDGYKAKGIIPNRKFFILSDSIIIVVDEIECKGVHNADSFIHFNPDIELYKLDGRVVTTLQGNKISIIPFSSGISSTNIVEDYYSPEFGVKMPNHVIKMTMELNSGFHYMGYMLVLNDEPATCNWNSLKGMYEIETDLRLIEIQYNNELHYKITEKQETL